MTVLSIKKYRRASPLSGQKPYDDSLRHMKCYEKVSSKVPSIRYHKYWQIINVHRKFGVHG